jgi:hypothetical protein
MSENGKKEPIVKNDESNIVGVELLIDSQNKVIKFLYISSSVKGSGEKIVFAVIKAAPKEWDIVVLLDWSNRFWSVMANKYPRLILA